MTSQASSSDENQSSGFFKLHEGIRQWIYEQKWDELREIQELAVDPILGKERDVILAAPTAAGKTEAAFLPICSVLLTERKPSIEAVYIGPLKALINDQFERLETLCERLQIPVCKWHGDVSTNAKSRLLRNPQGILLITPESLEALFMRRGSAIPSLFKHVSHLVIDELHAFIGAERGAQLQSLLHRLEHAVDRRIPRIGLSATLGNMGIAAEFLRPRFGKDVLLVSPEGPSQEIRLQIRGYVKDLATEPNDQTKDGEKEASPVTGDEKAIADHLMATLRGSNNLVFCNSRRAVEIYSDLLRTLSEKQNLPNEFFPHHGNLAKNLREDLEKRLKAGQVPTTALATSTLELGIDIGSVKSIAQIGPPFSVSSMRQRLGRSGRRGEAATIRFYIQEAPLSSKTSILHNLRMNLFQTTAMVNLLLAKWCEPPSNQALHLSTLVQQTLSVIAQYGGARPKDLWKVLCHEGPFQQVPESMFADLLRSLGSHDMITQCQDGTLVTGLAGEALINHYEFYTAFSTPEEYRVVADGKQLGTIPLEGAVLPGMFIIFAGRRWEVLSVEAKSRLILVRNAGGGSPPKFGGSVEFIDAAIRKEMLRLYTSTEVATFLDSQAREFLAEGRQHFKLYKLNESSIVEDNGNTLIFPWDGDKVVNTLAVELLQSGLKPYVCFGVITVNDMSSDDLISHMQRLAAIGSRDPVELASLVPNKLKEKHDGLLSESLLTDEYAAKWLDTQGTWAFLQSHFT